MKPHPSGEAGRAVIFLLLTSLLISFSVVMLKRAFARLEQHERSHNAAIDAAKAEAGDGTATRHHRRFAPPSRHPVSMTPGDS